MTCLQAGKTIRGSQKKNSEKKLAITGLELSERSTLVVDVEDVGEVGVDSELKAEGGLRRKKSASVGRKESKKRTMYMRAGSQVVGLLMISTNILKVSFSATATSRGMAAMALSSSSSSTAWTRP